MAKTTQYLINLVGIDPTIMVDVSATVTARFDKVLRTIPFEGRISIQKLAEYALRDRKLALSSAIGSEVGHGSDDYDARQTLYDHAEEHGVSFTAPKVIDSQKAERQAAEAMGALDHEAKLRVAAELGLPGADKALKAFLKEQAEAAIQELTPEELAKLEEEIEA